MAGVGRSTAATVAPHASNGRTGPSRRLRPAPPRCDPPAAATPGARRPLGPPLPPTAPGRRPAPRCRAGRGACGRAAVARGRAARTRRGLAPRPGPRGVERRAAGAVDERLDRPVGLAGRDDDHRAAYGGQAGLGDPLPARQASAAPPRPVVGSAAGSGCATRSPAPPPGPRPGRPAAALPRPPARPGPPRRAAAVGTGRERDAVGHPYIMAGAEGPVRLATGHGHPRPRPGTAPKRLRRPTGPRAAVDAAGRSPRHATARATIGMNRVEAQQLATLSPLGVGRGRTDHRETGKPVGSPWPVRSVDTWTWSTGKWASKVRSCQSASRARAVSAIRPSVLGEACDG